jgi:hypothetical protein
VADGFERRRSCAAEPAKGEVCRDACGPTVHIMRDIEAIDADLRLLSRAWRVARVMCDPMPSTQLIDQLLEERAAAAAGVRHGRKSA